MIGIRSKPKINEVHHHVYIGPEHQPVGMNTSLGLKPKADHIQSGYREQTIHEILAADAGA